jgi:hypothetical protein
MKTMRSTIRDLGIRHRTQMTLADIARWINPLLRLDRILRAIRAIGAAPCAPTRQPDASGLGEAEVQALCCS